MIRRQLNWERRFSLSEGLKTYSWLVQIKNITIICKLTLGLNVNHADYMHYKDGKLLFAIEEEELMKNFGQVTIEFN